MNHNQVNLIINQNEEYSLINQETKRTFIDQQKWRLLHIVKLSNQYDKSQIETYWSDEYLAREVSHEKNRTHQSRSNTLIATCYCVRRPGFYLFNAFFLIFLITLSSLTVFSIPKDSNRLQTIYTILLSNVSFKWVFNRSLPDVSYLTLLDKYSICSILYITISAIYHSFIATFYVYLPEVADKCMLIVFMMVFVSFHLGCVVIFYSVTTKQRLIQIEERLFVIEHLNKKSLNPLIQE